MPTKAKSAPTPPGRAKVTVSEVDNLTITKALADMSAMVNQMLQQTQQQQQALNQALQSAQQTGGSLAADKKTQSYNSEKSIDDIGTDEAFKSKTLNDSHQWTQNAKAAYDRFQEVGIRSSDIAHEREQSKARMQMVLDHVTQADAMFWSAFRMGVGFEYAQKNLDPLTKLKRAETISKPKRKK